MDKHNPLLIKAPASLTRSEKARFRGLSEHIKASNSHPNPGLADLLADYCMLRTRIDELAKQRAQAVVEKSSLTVEKARVLQLGREINSATALSLKLADRLGI